MDRSTVGHGRVAENSCVGTGVNNESDTSAPLLISSVSGNAHSLWNPKLNSHKPSNPTKETLLPELFDNPVNPSIHSPSARDSRLKNSFRRTRYQVKKKNSLFRPGAESRANKNPIRPTIPNTTVSGKTPVNYTAITPKANVSSEAKKSVKTKSATVISPCNLWSNVKAHVISFDSPRRTLQNEVKVPPQIPKESLGKKKNTGRVLKGGPTKKGARAKFVVLPLGTQRYLLRERKSIRKEYVEKNLPQKNPVLTSTENKESHEIITEETSDLRTEELSPENKISENNIGGESSHLRPEERKSLVDNHAFGLKPDECEKCIAGFASQDLLVQHLGAPHLNVQQLPRTQRSPENLSRQRKSIQKGNLKKKLRHRGTVYVSKNNKVSRNNIAGKSSDLTPEERKSLVDNHAFGLKPDECEICIAGFASQDLLVHHLKTPPKDYSRRYYNVPNDLYLKLNMLMKRMAIHGKFERFHCSTCELTWPSSNLLIGHFVQHHCKDEDDVCEMYYNRNTKFVSVKNFRKKSSRGASSRKVKSATHHPSSRPPASPTSSSPVSSSPSPATPKYSCPNCPQKFVSVNLWKHHICRSQLPPQSQILPKFLLNGMLGPKPKLADDTFACCFCMRFFEMKKLKSHMKIHMGEHHGKEDAVNMEEILRKMTSIPPAKSTQNEAGMRQEVSQHSPASSQPSQEGTNLLVTNPPLEIVPDQTGMSPTNLIQSLNSSPSEEGTNKMNRQIQPLGKSPMEIKKNTEGTDKTNQSLTPSAQSVPILEEVKETDRQTPVEFVSGQKGMLQVGNSPPMQITQNKKGMSLMNKRAPNKITQNKTGLRQVKKRSRVTKKKNKTGIRKSAQVNITESKAGTHKMNKCAQMEIVTSQTGLTKSTEVQIVSSQTAIQQSVPVPIISNQTGIQQSVPVPIVSYQTGIQQSVPAQTISNQTGIQQRLQAPIMLNPAGIQQRLQAPIMLNPAGIQQRLQAPIMLNPAGIQQRLQAPIMLNPAGIQRRLPVQILSNQAGIQQSAPAQIITNQTGIQQRSQAPTISNQTGIQRRLQAPIMLNPAGIQRRLPVQILSNQAGIQQSAPAQIITNQTGIQQRSQAPTISNQTGIQQRLPAPIISSQTGIQQSAPAPIISNQIGIQPRLQAPIISKQTGIQQSISAQIISNQTGFTKRIPVVSNQVGIQQMNQSALLQCQIVSNPTGMHQRTPVQMFPNNTGMQLNAPVKIVTSQTGRLQSAPMQVVLNQTGIQQINPSASMQVVPSQTGMLQSAPVQIAPNQTGMHQYAPVQILSNQAGIQPMDISTQLEMVLNQLGMGLKKDNAPAQLIPNQTGMHQINQSASVQIIPSKRAIHHVDKSAPLVLNQAAIAQMNQSAPSRTVMNQNAPLEIVTNPTGIQQVNKKAPVQNVPVNQISEMNKSAPVKMVPNLIGMQTVDKTAPGKNVPLEKHQQDKGAPDETVTNQKRKLARIAPRPAPSTSQNSETQPQSNQLTRKKQQYLDVKGVTNIIKTRYRDQKVQQNPYIRTETVAGTLKKLRQSNAIETGSSSPKTVQQPNITRESGSSSPKTLQQQNVTRESQSSITKTRQQPNVATESGSSITKALQPPNVGTETELGTEKIQCIFCKSKFSSSSDCQLHMKLEHSVSDSSKITSGPYKCLECDLSFRECVFLMQHAQIHSGYKHFRCIKCGLSFDIYDYVSHIASHDLKDEQFYCEVCLNYYQTDLMRQMHKCDKNLRYPPEPKMVNGKLVKHFCCVCDKGFFNNHNLQMHFILHTSVRPIVCTICGQGFTAFARLQEHVDEHMSKKSKVLYPLLVNLKDLKGIEIPVKKPRIEKKKDKK